MNYYNHTPETPILEVEKGSMDVLKGLSASYNISLFRRAVSHSLVNARNANIFMIYRFSSRFSLAYNNE